MHKVLDRRRKARENHDVRVHSVHDSLDVVLVELMHKDGFIEAFRDPGEHLHPDVAVAHDQNVRLRGIARLIASRRPPGIIGCIVDLREPLLVIVGCRRLERIGYVFFLELLVQNRVGSLDNSGSNTPA